MPQTARPHTGRARNERTTRDILDAALELARRDPLSVTVDAIAARAHVGRQTVYRWWASKDALLLDALLQHAGDVVIEQRTGVLAVDLDRFLTSTFAALSSRDGTAGLLRALMAKSQTDSQFSILFRDRFIEPRRAALLELVVSSQAQLVPGADPEVVCDAIFGAMWYRLLVGHGRLDVAFARQLIALFGRADSGADVPCDGS